ncbi:thioesterase II family protein [Streptomyces sp. NPDC053750]|uniref:thioesterase II family protein n=1 Tax=Streptomyces sp. NPDC053750 TaxID=3365714 RepID=UPI0037D2C118
MTDADEWIIRFSPEPRAPVRLVCFPHAGGSASFFFPLAGALAPDAEVLAVQYPGRQNRRHEPCVDDVHALADAVAQALGARSDGRPFALFGHSMGSLVAFETARRLQTRGAAPSVLFASGRPAPSCLRADTVHLRDDQGILDEIRAVGGTDARILDDPELLSFALPALRADYRAVETYRAVEGAAVACPVTVLTGDHDPRVSVAEAEGWAVHTTGGFSMRVFPGGHFYLAELAREVAEAIRTTLRGTPGAEPDLTRPSITVQRTPAGNGGEPRSDGFLTRSGH